MKKLQVPVEVELLQEAKLFALKNGKTLKEIVSEALKAYITSTTTNKTNKTNTIITSIPTTSTTTSNTDTSTTNTNTTTKKILTFEDYQKMKAEEAEDEDDTCTMEDAEDCYIPPVPSQEISKPSWLDDEEIDPMKLLED